MADGGAPKPSPKPAELSLCCSRSISDGGERVIAAEEPVMSALLSQSFLSVAAPGTRSGSRLFTYEIKSGSFARGSFCFKIHHLVESLIDITCVLIRRMCSHLK